jgi:uncharacterized protein (DUF1015 family)
VELRPFHGIVYDPAHVDDVFAVLAPPYDVISQQEREMYYQRHQHNVVRLIYGRDELGDTPQDNRYTRAADYLRTWLQRGVLRRDTHPAMYLCAEEHRLSDGSRRERHGLIALCRLAPYDQGIVLPHEETSPVPKRMLIELRSAVEANLSQVFALYEDKTGRLGEIFAAQRQRPADLRFHDSDHMLHQVWRVGEPGVLQDIQGLMSERWAIVADGHHRYETCLEYQRLRRQAIADWTGEEWFNFAMMYLTDIHDPGLTILPTHRLLRGLTTPFVAQLPERLGRTCQVEALPFHRQADRQEQVRQLVEAMQSRGASGHVMGLYTGGDTFWLLTCSGSATGLQLGHTAPMAVPMSLDVGLLHEFLLEKVLGLNIEEDDICFTQDALTAVDLVEQQAYQVAFLLNPTKVEQIVQHAMAGRRMPRKSTYFYPKLLTGIVMHKEVGDADHFG